MSRFVAHRQIEIDAEGFRRRNGAHRSRSPGSGGLACAETEIEIETRAGLRRGRSYAQIEARQRSGPPSCRRADVKIDVERRGGVQRRLNAWWESRHPAPVTLPLPY